MIDLNILLEAKPAAGPNPMSSIFMFVLILVVFYFFMIRPQQKKAKEARKFSENLDKGQDVVTIGGIHGKIEEVRDTTVILKVEGGTKLKVEKRAISADSTLLNSPSQPK
jgi:preprotein translocase subunit YajC